MDRRRFLGIAAAGALTLGTQHAAMAAREDPPKRKSILVWGDAADAVAAALAKLPGGYTVRIVAPGDAGQVLAQASLDTAAVFVWCTGNSATPQQSDITDEVAGRIARAAREVGTGVVALGVPSASSPLFRVLFGNAQDGRAKAGKSGDTESLLHVAEPHHPIARGVRDFTLARGSVQGEDKLLIANGEAIPFRIRNGATGAEESLGACWTAAKGRIFRFLPGPAEISKQAEGRRILRNAVLWAARDESGLWEDADPSARAARGAGEPPLALILRDAGYGGADVTAGGEASIPLLVKAGPGPVKVTLIAAYGVAKTSRGGWYTPADPVQRVELWQGAPENNKQMRPPLAPGSKTEFDPGDVPFGIWIASDGFPGEFIYTEDARQAAISRFGTNHHKAHPYAAVRSDGKPVSNAYLIGFEYSTNDDNQEAVLLVENVRAK